MTSILETRLLNTDILVDLTTLAASAVGQLTFGVLADVYGRRALYGNVVFMFNMAVLLEHSLTVLSC